MELLDRLRRSVRDCVTRRSELEKDTALRTTRLRAQHEQALTAEQARWAAETEKTNSTAAANQTTIEATFATRKTRIAKALNNAQQERLKRIEAEEGKHTFENQSGLFEAERVRDAETLQNKTQHESFTTELTNERAALDQLTARARATLSGFGSLARLIDHPPVTHLLNPTAPESELLNQLRLHRDQAAHELTRCNALVLPLLFRFFRIWLLLPLALLVPFAFVPELRRFDFANVPTNVWLILGGSLAGIIVLYVLAKKLVTPRAQAAAMALASAHQLAEVCGQKSEARFKAETQRIQSAFTATTQELNNNWKQVRANARSLRNDWTDRLNEQARQLSLRNDERRRVELNRSAARQAEHTAQLHEQTSTKTQTLESSYAENLNRITATRDDDFRALEAEWQNVVLPTLASLQQASAEAKELFPRGIPSAGIPSACRTIFFTRRSSARLPWTWKSSAKSRSPEANWRCLTSANSPCRCKFPCPRRRRFCSRPKPPDTSRSSAH